MFLCLGPRNGSKIKLEVIVIFRVGLKEREKKWWIPLGCLWSGKKYFDRQRRLLAVFTKLWDLKMVKNSNSNNNS